MPTAAKFIIPIKLPSLANTRMHWRAMDKLKREQKEAVALFMHGAELPPLPVVVTITRIGKRTLDDDNLSGAGKYVRDQIAKCYGVDDGSPLYRWRYGQKIGRYYGVEIEIERA